MKLWHSLLTLVMTGGAVTCYFAEQRRHEAQLDGVRTDLAALATSVAEAQRSAASVERPLRAPIVIAPAPSENGPPEKVPAAEPPPKDTSSLRPVAPAQVRAQLDTTFAREGADPKWTGQAQAAAQSRLAVALPETSSLRSIECRSSMCRFETVHEDIEHVQQFMQGAFMSSETHIWNGGFFSTVVPEPGNDKVVIVSYLARDGEELDPMR